MSDEEKEFIKKINVDKAKKKTKIPIILIIPIPLYIIGNIIWILFNNVSIIKLL